MNKLYILIIIMISLMINKNNYSQEKYSSIVERNNQFTFSLFSKINENTNENVFISGFSVTTALSMAYDGSKWFTAREMRNVLNYNKDRKQSHQEFTELLKFYKNLKTSLFNIANAAVAQKDYPFLDSYFELVKNYGAILKSANFRNDNDRELARSQINKWVSEKTNNNIEELLNESSLNALTRLVLLNAIHFKANWKQEFSEEYTKSLEFIGLDKKSRIDFMNSKDKYAYYQNDNLQFLELPYEDNQASMFIILPSHEIDFNNFVLEFNNNKFNEYLNNVKETLVELSFPKFKQETEYELKEILKEMGINRAFSHKANFSGMTGNKELMIDEVIHKAFIEVDEKGTEASAATAVIMREKSAKRPISMNINRPFVFIIQENQLNSILFIGKITNL